MAFPHPPAMYLQLKADNTFAQTRSASGIPTTKYFHALQHAGNVVNVAYTRELKSLALGGQANPPLFFLVNVSRFTSNDIDQHVRRPPGFR